MMTFRFIFCQLMVYKWISSLIYFHFRKPHNPVFFIEVIAIKFNNIWCSKNRFLSWTPTSLKNNIYWASPLKIIATLPMNPIPQKTKPQTTTFQRQLRKAQIRSSACRLRGFFTTSTLPSRICCPRSQGLLQNIKRLPQPPVRPNR